MKTVNNFVEIEKNSIQSPSEDTINFSQPLAITDDSRQWNMTKYDIDSLDVNDYDGVVTINHGQDIADVVGKVVNLRKDKLSHKILIDGIKFAINANPVAILAKNLLKEGFVTGVSIETIGEEADDTLTWKNHKLSGLSIVAHPNNKNAYAVVANSINEAKNHGLKTNRLELLVDDSIYKQEKLLYNKNMKVENKGTGSSKGGNPWHDELGRFTVAPFGAITYIGTGEYNSEGKYIGHKGKYIPGYDVDENKATLTVDLSSKYKKDSDGEYQWYEVEDISESDFEKSLNDSIEQFKTATLEEFKKRKDEKNKEKQEKIKKAAKIKEAGEKFMNLSLGDISKAAKKYENEIRKANPKAEKKLSNEKKLNLTDFVDKANPGVADGRWILKGSDASKKTGNSYYTYDERGYISKFTDGGDVYLDGTATPANGENIVYGLLHYSDSKSVERNIQQLTTSTVNDYMGVPASSVDYNDFYNKMVKSIATSKAIEELLNKD